MKKWVGHKKILTWFWDRTVSDYMLGRLLDSDKDLVQWCLEHDCGITATWVQCPDEETFLLFALRWT